MSVKQATDASERRLMKMFQTIIMLSYTKEVTRLWGVAFGVITRLYNVLCAKGWQFTLGLYYISRGTYIYSAALRLHTRHG